MSHAGRIAVVAELFRRFRRGWPAAMDPPCSTSLHVVASAALKPGSKTWLVARAISLRAF